MDRDEQRDVYRTIDLALRVGEVLLSSGAGTADATATILGVTAACGLRGCEVDITFTWMAVSYQASPDVAPETHIRLVRYRGVVYFGTVRFQGVTVGTIPGPSAPPDGGVTRR